MFRDVVLVRTQIDRNTGVIDKVRDAVLRQIGPALAKLLGANRPNLAEFGRQVCLDLGQMWASCCLRVGQLC